jgi:two-component system NtrC family sensor kinase
MKTTENKKMAHYYRFLGRSIFLTIVIVSSIPLYLISGIILYQFNNSYHEKVYAHLGELVRKHKQNIDSFLNEKLSDIHFLARNFKLEELSDEKFLKSKLDALQYEYEMVFVDLGVINSKGEQVAYAGPFKLARAEYSNSEWFQKAMQSEYYISDVFLGLRGLPHFIIAVRTNYKEETWILRATIDFVSFNSIVEKIRIGETGFAYIVNKKGELQTKPYLDIKASEQVYMDFLHDVGIEKELRIVKKRDNNGKRNIYVAALLKNGDWLLIYQQNSSDAFKNLHNTLKVTIILVLIGGLCIVLMAYTLSQRMVTKVARGDTEKVIMNEKIVETGKLATVGELASGVAHEINNPVAIMVEEAGWIGDLLEEEDLKQSKNLDEFKRALDQIKTQGKRCKEITHKLLSFARKTDSKTQVVSINNLIKEVIALSSQRAKYSKVDLTTDLKQDLPILELSPSEIQQVLLNLINNALDAMENKGGSLIIKTRSEEKDIVIDISDTGPGIPDANISRIFDPFFTTKPVGKGTGLGLSICYGIIHKMGGQITVSSVVDEGTTFHIHLPTQQNVDDNISD